MMQNSDTLIAVPGTACMHMWHVRMQAMGNAPLRLRRLAPECYTHTHIHTQLSTTSSSGASSNTLGVRSYLLRQKEHALINTFSSETHRHESVKPKTQNARSSLCQVDDDDRMMCICWSVGCSAAVLIFVLRLVLFDVMQVAAD